MSTDDENKTPAEKFTDLVNEAARVEASKKRTSRDLQPNLHETLTIAGQVAEDVVAPVERKLRWNGWLTFAGGLFVLVGSVGGGILATQSIAKDKTNELIAPVKTEVAANKERLEFFKDEFKRHIDDEHGVHLEQSRTNENLSRQLDKVRESQDLTLDALKVPMSKRPKREPQP